MTFKSNDMKTTQPKTEYILRRIAELKETQHISRTLLAVCPNSMAVIKAAFRSAKRNNAPIKFAATLNQVDCDGGYTGMTQSVFTDVLRMESRALDRGRGPRRAVVERYTVRREMGYR